MGVGLKRTPKYRYDTNQAWVWLAICRKTRQVVAYVTGDRSEKTCRKLWNAIPATYRSGTWYTDFWKAYALVIPDDQHEAVGKETGETVSAQRFRVGLPSLTLQHTRHNRV